MRQARFTQQDIMRLLRLSEPRYQRLLARMGVPLPPPSLSSRSLAWVSGPVERGDAPTENESVNGGNVVKAPGKAGNAPENAGEHSPEPENVPSTFTPAEQAQVLLAYAELLKAGKPVTRTGIRDQLGWDNKQYTRVIKPVCDKYHIGEVSGK
jgi:hypothetical protein